MRLYKLVMKDDLGNQVSYALDKPVNTIGRGSKNNIVLDEESVSKHHATIRFVDGKPMIEDNGSTNGTFVNDYRITAPYEIKEGDELILSNCLFHLRTEEAQSPEQTVTVMKPK